MSGINFERERIPPGTLCAVSFNDKTYAISQELNYFQRKNFDWTERQQTFLSHSTTSEKEKEFQFDGIIDKSN